MKTLIYTAIYSNLYGTSFGGRSSRQMHYRYSLLNILNTQANKYICFTSEEEIKDLEKFFYAENKISADILTFIEFDLKNTKYYDIIYRLKDLEKMKTHQRCYEVQYNKFFWIDYLLDRYSYDKIFWIDSGLSHCGLIPNQYSTTNHSIAKYYTFSLFNNSFLNKINTISSDKLLILNKNNTKQFYWSRTIPNNYYLNYNNSWHTVGGAFGGNPNNLDWFKNEFESLCVKLLQNEKELYDEELIMSCIRTNYSDKFVSLDFDDWYARDSHGSDVKLFYHILL